MKAEDKTGFDGFGQHLGGKKGETFESPQKPKTRRRKRGSAVHVGVKILRRRGAKGETWFARWKDPISGRTQENSLSRLGLTTAESRRVWAEEKSKEITALRHQISFGVVKAKQATPDDAISDYLLHVAANCKPSTVLNYKEAIKVFARWISDSPIKYISELKQQELLQFHDFWVCLGKKTAVRGTSARRGSKFPTTKARSAHSINKGIRTIRTMLGWWRKRGYTPLLNTDIITDAMEMKRTTRSLPNFLNPEL